MRLYDILNALYKISKSRPGISEPMICGGVVRDRVIGDAQNKYADLDITTGDATIRLLADAFAEEVGKNYKIKKTVAKDGHVSVHIGDFKIDFSSNYIDPEIKKALAEKGITNPTPLQAEMFSRDFTCNSLLLRFNLKEVIDPIGSGLSDIKDKIIRTSLAPKYTFPANPRRIVRIFYIAAKLGFSVDAEIISFMKQNHKLIDEIEPSFLIEKLEKAMELDADRTIKLIDAMDLWLKLPLIPSLVPYMKGRIKTSQFFTNYDYVDSSSGPGASVYRDMSDGKVQSIQEWRKKRRKKRMKNLRKVLDTRKDS